MRKNSESESNIDDLKAFLGEGTEFKGVLSFSGTVRVDGNFEGEILSDDTLIVGESATLEADITVGTVISKGRIKGNITASKKIEIRAESRVVGNIKTSTLTIDEGAVFDGQCEMVPRDAKNLNFNEEDDERDILVNEEIAVSV